MNGENFRAAICTLGCRVNQYESEAVCNELRALGFEICDFSSLCDVYIVNTCAVTGESERKSRQMVRRAVKTNPTAHVIVMGCFSQIHAEAALMIPGVSYVCGNRNKLGAAEAAIRLCRGESIDRASLLDVEAAPIEKMTIHRSDRTRAYVKIEDGCDNNCSYCIIKKARGAVVSRSEDDICAEVKTLVEAGYREVVLTGIETASYGKDTGEDLCDLIARVADIEGVSRIRLGSLEPSVLTPHFTDVVSKIDKLMPSFHLSLQSGSSRILALMRRKYNADMVLGNVEYMKSKIENVTFTADIIVGFPGETEEDFLETCELAKKVGFLHMHVFPFSPREGTDAAVMSGQLSEEEKHERLIRLENIGGEISDGIYRAALLKNSLSVLFETPHGGYETGHSGEMLEVMMKSDMLKTGEICSVRPTEYKNGHLFVTLIGGDK